ncbi:MAG TPA: gliding motility protein GldC [Chitinophaga sp.]|uniref:Gliding motility protein GldC n=1 Tax=Chitinophaga tropicalis TaxID=2683588 RepID=A0A7K1TZ56_9BACT|nr:gliding motility protein GldC [Chitinophaga tropicalis]MVT07401.1 gliding motility protein GldC [Chitinophaga tropicalis]HJT75461.1 gliding motility protein GldC [Chitinophaga sp.]
MAKTSTIQIQVGLDEDRIPEKIEWRATDSSESDRFQQAKAMMIAFWDGGDKTALRIDLWTKSMMVDEMADFFYQTMMTMADTYQRATPYKDQADDLRKFAKDFFKKFEEKQKQEQ